MSEIRKFLVIRFTGNNDYAEHLGRLLVEYQESGVAPPHLVSEITSGCDGKLWAGVWEAMLYRHLSSLGFTPRGTVTKSNQFGPDFAIEHKGRRIWIEAVTPAPKDIPLAYLEPPKQGEISLKPVPYEERVLRWTSVLRDKRNKLESYRRQKIIGDTDCTVIAVNSCRLQDYAPHDLASSRLPFAVEAVFPIGPIAFPITPAGEPDGEPRHVPRYTIRKPNGSPVRTDNFLDPRFANVSAIVGYWKRDMLNGGLHLTLVHNPLATNPLPRGVLGAQKEYVAEPEGDHYVLQLLSVM
jgi:type I restriction enzyme S subunit